MGTIKMMQGDSYYVFIDMKQYEETLMPDIVDDLEVSVGEDLQYSVSEGRVGFDTATNRWFFRPTQEETFSLEPGQYNVIVRVKYANDPMSDVKGVMVGKIIIEDSYSEEVL